MPLILPFAGLRPMAARARDVIAPPYDVMSRAEAREMIAGRPWSFLHISRPEASLPESVHPYAPEVYQKAAENLAEMRRQGVLIQDPSPCFYVYRLTMDGHIQTGIVAIASVAAYDQGRIKKHEHTRPKKEDDRVRQIEALNAQTGPVFLVYKSDGDVDRVLADVANGPSAVDVLGGDGVRHQLWVIDDEPLIGRLTGSFDGMPALYVADGHHRSAAASRVAASRNETSHPAAGPAESPHNYFLAVLFPHDQVRILDYNRVVRDLNGLGSEGFLDEVVRRFSVSISSEPFKPAAPGEFGMYLSGQWYRLQFDLERLRQCDPVGRLDVSILTRELLEPVLGIGDQRSDERIDFVGGIRGLRALEQRVESGEMAVAFSLFPTGMEALMAVADAGSMMPPKSTWFEPKLADGLVSHLL
ncbi:MAG: DUF1015 domain-containing protein [Gammaproteobacteria bacterium]|nr:DUF1015 domain-containing protein [Gammaproteobacteria bacterium]